MDLWHEVNWYAIQTKPRKETSAANNIARLGVEVFLPQTNPGKLVIGIGKSEVKPLFSGYLFARFCPSSYMHMIHYARGVRRILSTGNALLPVDQSIIDVIKSSIEDHSYSRPAYADLRSGDRVLIESGPLKGLIGVFKAELTNQQRVEILIETIECQARILVQNNQVKLVQPITATMRD